MWPTVPNELVRRNFSYVIFYYHHVLIISLQLRNILEGSITKASYVLVNADILIVQDFSEFCNINMFFMHSFEMLF